MGRDVELLMIDSGAFTVWNSGETIDLDAYIKFCKKYLKEIDIIIALDIIPGEPNNKLSLTKAAITQACEQGWENYQKMIDAGLPKDKIMPVFHQNDNWKWLEKFMDEKIPYFGLSPANDSSSYVRQLWLDSCMKYVCNDKGMPLVKFHGFAVTSIPLMVRYPWYSCDSASWIKFAIYGSLMIPRRAQDGSWNFLRPPQRVFFSTKIGENASERGAHYNQMPPHQKRILKAYVKQAGAEIGKSKFRKESLDYKRDPKNENIFEKKEDHMVIEEIIEPGVSNHIRWRSKVNMYFFSQVEELLEWPRPFKHIGRGLI